MTRDEHARRIIKRYDDLIDEVGQIIVDVEFWNRTHPEHPPFDVEADRLVLAQLRMERTLFVQGRSHEIDSGTLVRKAGQAVRQGEGQ